jgi:hypothetical protein
MRIVVAVLALALAGSAEAKGPDHAAVCGATRCVTVTGDIHVASLLDWKGTPFMVLDAPKPGPYYEITIRGWGAILYVRSRNLIRMRDETGLYWRVLPAYLRPTYTKLVRGMAPRPAPATWPGS